MITAGGRLPFCDAAAETLANIKKILTFPNFTAVNFTEIKVEINLDIKNILLTFALTKTNSTMEKVYILLSTARSTNETNVDGVYGTLEKARAEMAVRYESSKKFWENQGTDGYEEVHIGIFNKYAEAYCVSSDYEEIGMSWLITEEKVQ